MSDGILYIVATPIGNLEDMTPRARQTLEHADVIAAEDTRRSSTLLRHFGIRNRLVSVHDHNEEREAAALIGELKRGRSVAMVCDAGTPLVSDPGFRVVRMARKEGIEVIPLPGACAAIAALSVAGLPSDRFNFEGFLPAKSEARRSALKSLAGNLLTMVFYESVHRIEESLADMAAAFGSDRRAFLAREISKVHEQYRAGSLLELRQGLESGEIVRKGEFVLVVGGAAAGELQQSFDSRALLEELTAVMPGKQAVEIVCRVSGRKRNEVYQEMLALQGDC